MKWNLPEANLHSEEWTNNLRFLYRLQEAMQEYALNGDFESLVEEFPIVRRAARIAEIAGAEIRN